MKHTVALPNVKVFSRVFLCGAIYNDAVYANLSDRLPLHSGPSFHLYDTDSNVFGDAALTYALDYPIDLRLHTQP